jgi:hypothetical protein
MVVIKHNIQVISVLSKFRSEQQQAEHIARKKTE